MSVATDITALLQTVLAPARLQLDNVSVTPAGRARVVRVTVESLLDDAVFEGEQAGEPIAGLDLDAIAAATRIIGDALDSSDVLGAQPYTLEVSSPGVSRPLRDPAHFRRNVGRLVRVRGADGSAQTGRVTRVTHTEVSLDIPAARKVPASAVTLAFADIAQGEVQVEFARTESAEDHAPDDPEEI